MANRLLDRIFNIQDKNKRDEASRLREFAISGSIFRLDSLKGDTSYQAIKTQIQTMRALARDSQISTALSYYATDATVTNSEGQIIWAVPKTDKDKEAAELVNDLFNRWDVNAYARDHILELATIGNLYIPTSDLYREDSGVSTQVNVALDQNTIVDKAYDVIPAYKVDPETVVHLYRQGQPYGYVLDPDENSSQYYLYPESSIIHFSLGGLLGDYKITLLDKSGNEVDYDIKFAQPLMEKAVQPTQTLALFEDALLLAAITRGVKFVNVECGDVDENEMRQTLMQIKDTIEQQYSLNTSTGDIQSYMNPQSVNNLVYLPKTRGQDPISITDLNMSDLTEADNKLLDHYQDKKLSVLGVPKEAMNFSSNEGLGGAGSVLSQRSQIYANSLERLETAYKSGWRDAINKYLVSKGTSDFVDKYSLRMQPIITTLSTIVSEKRDAAVGQTSQIVDLLKSLGVVDSGTYKDAVEETLTEEFPSLASNIMSWDVDVTEGEDSGEF